MTSSVDPAALVLPELGPPLPAAEPGIVADGALVLPELDPGGDERSAAPVPRSPWDEARDRGFTEGLAEGSARAQQRVRSAIDSLGRVGEYLHSTQNALLRDRARDLHVLALAVARKLVQRELTVDPGLVERLVAQALELMPDERGFEVRLHPDDLAAFGDETRPGAGAERGAAIRWVADPRLERGEFVVEGPHRIVDGRADFALRALYERLDAE